MDFLDHLKAVSSKDKNLDWANLCYYWKENEQLSQLSENKSRVVFIGDSNTEQMGTPSPEFFKTKK